MQKHPLGGASLKWKLLPLNAKQHGKPQILQAREELGDTYELVELGETATVDRLLQDLVIEERLAMIDRCVKRLNTPERTEEFVDSALFVPRCNPSGVAAHSRAEQVA